MTKTKQNAEPQRPALPVSMPDGIPPGSVEAAPFMREIIAKRLKAARVEANLTQAALAEMMGVPETRITLAEGGERVGAAFINRWVKVCGLSDDWKPKA